MPHQCTNCGRAFPDGSKEMLSGCPDCGGNKFQFKPASATGGSSASSSASPSSGPSQSSTSSDAGDDAEPSAMDRPWPDTARPDDESASAEASADDPAAGTETPERSSPSSSSPSSKSSSSPSSEPRGGARESETAAESTPDDEEDSAQASARSDVVSRDEIAAAGPPTDAVPEHDSEIPAPEEEDRPDLAELRAELNSQFESIKILSPGTYELNLMELYDREEYIISLQEDGRYVIEVPDTWRGDRGE